MSTERAQKLVPVGKVVRPHGVRGELKVLEGEESSGAWRQVKEVFIGRAPETAKCFRVVQVRATAKLAILELEGVGSMDEAERLRGQDVFVPREALPAPDADEYYADDLLGLLVEDTQGRPIGVLDGFFDNGAHEIYVVRKGSREILVPVVDGVVVSVDLEGGVMVIAPPPGLRGLDD